MKHYDVKRLALVLAKQAEIEGMKIANKQREIHGDGPIYHHSHFEEKAFELESLAYKHDDRL